MGKQLKDLIFTILERFVKHDVLKEISLAFQLINLDFKCEQNLLSIESIDVGFGVKYVLGKLKTTEKSKKKKKRKFRSFAQSFLIKRMKKLVEKCPLKYKVVFGFHLYS